MRTEQKHNHGLTDRRYAISGDPTTYALEYSRVRINAHRAEAQTVA